MNVPCSIFVNVDPGQD